MVAEQADCSLDDAISKLKERAAATSRTIPDTARLVISRVIRFDLEAN